MWPAPTVWTTHLAGHHGDGWQNLFNLWWVREALASGQNPYYTPYMFHPEGVSLLFHTISPYNALLGALLQIFTGLFSAYNSLILIHYALAGYAGYRLALHLTGDRLAAIAAGLLFTLSPFHFYHGREHLQLTAIEGVPLALLFLIRTLEQPRWRNAVLLGLFLALVTFSDLYLLLFTVLAGLFLCGGRLAALGRTAIDRALMIRLGLAAGLYLVLAGPLLGAMIHGYATTEFVSGREAAPYSADLQSLFLPGPLSAWGGVLGDTSARWSGNPTEQSAYLGYLLLLGALLGLVRARALPYRRTFGLLALFAALLALGPELWIGGERTGVPLPYAGLQATLPLLFTFTGGPARYSLLTNLALVLLLAGGLSWLRQRLGGARGTAAAAGVTLLALVELAPGPHAVARMETPPPFAAWAADRQEYSVVDTRRWAPIYWGIITHGKPLVNGHVSRDPLDRLQALHDSPVFDILLFGHGRYGLEFEPTIRTVVGELALDWRDGPPAEGVPADFFGLRLEGVLEVPRSGKYRLRFESSDAFRFWFDGELRLDRSKDGGAVRVEAGPLFFNAGAHALRIEFYEGDGKANFSLLWQGPGQPDFTPIGAASLRTPGGEPGLLALLGPRRPGLAGGRAAAFADLRARDVRYVLRWPWQNRFLEERVLGLPRIYQDELVVIYEVPRPLGRAGAGR